MIDLKRQEAECQKKSRNLLDGTLGWITAGKSTWFPMAASRVDR